MRQIGRGSTTPITTITNKNDNSMFYVPLRVNKRCVPIFLCVYSRMQKRRPINIKCRGKKLPRKPQLGHNEGLTSQKQETRNANWLCTHVSTEFDIKLFSPARKNKEPDSKKIYGREYIRRAQGNAREPVAKQLLAEGDGLRGGKHCKKIKCAMSKNVFLQCFARVRKTKNAMSKNKTCMLQLAFSQCFFEGGGLQGGVNTAKKKCYVEKCFLQCFARVRKIKNAMSKNKTCMLIIAFSQCFFEGDGQRGG